MINLLENSKGDLRNETKLSQEELKELKNSSAFNILTYKAILSYASYGSEEILDEIKKSVKDSLEARMRLRRVGIEVAAFGFGLPMIALQMPPEVGIPAFLGLRGIYLSTIGKAMWKDRNRARHNDAVLVEEVYNAMDKIDPGNENMDDSQRKNKLLAKAFESAIHTEYIEELWGLSPEIATIAALFVAGQLSAAIVNLGLIGTFRGVLKIVENKRKKSANRSLIRGDDEIPQIITTSSLKDLFSVATIFLSLITNNPSLSASLAIGTTQVASAELTKSTYKTQKPPHEDTYNKFNKLLTLALGFKYKD